jgi:hypothetical protein
VTLLVGVVDRTNLLGRRHTGAGRTNRLQLRGFKKGTNSMEYEFTIGMPITESEALKQVAAMGFHGLAFDDSHDEDEMLHWHEFAAVTWVISGSGSVENEDGKVLDLGPGCRLQAPAGYLHRALAGTNARLVIGTDLPAEKWTSPLNKEPADRPAALSN